MKALITGGAGFIGSHIQDRLINLGHEVIVIDNLRSGKKENLNPKAQFFNIDLVDFTALSDLFQKLKPEVIFHLAAQNEVAYSMEHPYEDQQINIVGTINLLEASRNVGVKKVIYSNTGGALYGDVPVNELPIEEDNPILYPTSFYGVSKFCAEMYLRLYGNAYRIPWVSLRYSNVYGPRQDGNKESGIVAIFTQKMLKGEIPTINGDGRNTRDYIYIDDVVEANLKALDYPKNDYFNIATGIETSNNQVFATIESYLNTGIKPHYGPPRPGDPFRVSLSIKKAKEKLKWQPKINFSEGIRLTIKYYQQ